MTITKCVVCSIILVLSFYRTHIWIDRHKKGAFRLFTERSLDICGLTLIFVGLYHFQLFKPHITLNISYWILHYKSRNNTHFLSIISSILSIYCATSLTFSHRSILPPGKSRLLMLPAPRATMFCFSSIIKHNSLTTPHYQVLSSILYFYNSTIKVLLGTVPIKFVVLLMYFHQICCTRSAIRYECLKGLLS